MDTMTTHPRLELRPLIEPHVLGAPEITGRDGTVLVPVSRTCRGTSRQVGAFAVGAGRVRYHPVYDPHRLALYGLAAVGLAAGAVVAVATRRRGPSIGSVQMGHGGWISLKGATAPRLRTAPNAARPWWARALRARRLVVAP